MNSEIETIIFDLGNYASNDKPQRDEHNVIIPFSLHYIDANLLFDYICELEEENKKLKQELDNANITKDNYVKLINRVGGLEERINKAIELIENNMYKETFGEMRNLATKEDYEGLLKILKGLLKILKGVENDSRNN